MKRIIISLLLLVSGCTTQNTQTLSKKSIDIEPNQVSTYQDKALCGKVISWRLDSTIDFPSVAFNEILNRHPDWRNKSHQLVAPPPSNASEAQVSCLWGGDIKERGPAAEDVTTDAPRTTTNNMYSNNVWPAPPPKNYRKLIISAIKRNLKDPDSIKDLSIGRPYKATLNYKETGKTDRYYAVCARYNAKNSYGAYVGTKGELYYFVGQIPFSSMMDGGKVSDFDPEFMGDCYP